MAGRIPTDTELVGRTLEGDRDAFEQIVSRYQSLVCSLAYSATGSLGQSQDLAQETFITAWKHLLLLRERDKLRAWLCGIVRRLIGKTLRREGREPTHAAETLDKAEDAAAPEAHPVEALISKEEQAVLWRAVERIPLGYREPLVLFYRERQSVEKVAAALDLSEDAVKQRLSRGRKLLQQEVLKFIEGALVRTAPNQSFTLGVMAVLPGVSSSTVAAGVGATFAKSGVVAKAAAWLAGINFLAGPLTGFTASYVGYKLSLQGATTERERSLIRRFYTAIAVCVVFPFVLALFAICARPLEKSHPAFYAGLLIGAGMLWVPGVALLLLWSRKRLCELSHPQVCQTPAGMESGPAPLWEYRSRATLLGIPLIHIRFGATWASLHNVITAWIAVGDGASVGLIFAFGGMAVAPITIGGFALGGLVFGGFGLGGVCYAGFALGIWAVGGVATGLKAMGGCAIAWKAAVGGIALAKDFAQGGIALAAHANDAAASAFCDNSSFFRNAFPLVTKWLWPTLLVSLLPTMFIARATKKRRRTESHQLRRTGAQP